VTTLLESPVRAVETPVPPQRSGEDRFYWIAAGAVLGFGLFLRFWLRSDLWLDEALSVNIAKLHVSQIPGALRHDGAPPLYYLLLHFWMRLFGQGDFAVRALSGLASVLALPCVWFAGRRLAGQRGAFAAVMVMGTSPFAIGYANSSRMYSLMVLWSLLGLLAFVRALEDPAPRRLAAVAVMAAVIIYTHYWGMYLLLAAGGWLLFRAWRPTATATASEADERRTTVLVIGAVAVGFLTFAPWIPTLLFQAAHTGTPWTSPAGLGDILGILGEYAGGGPWGALLGLSLFTMLLLGLFGRLIDERHILLELRTRRRARPIACIFITTLVIAVIASGSAGSAFVGRYTAVVYPLFILLVGLGVSLFPDRRIMAGVLFVICGSGLTVAFGGSNANRTEAGLVADVLNQQVQPGDLVVYCPDQLAPAVDRLLRHPVAELTFPRAIGPQRVDWVDYRQVIARTNVAAFAQDMIQRVGKGNTLWYVWRRGYPALGQSSTQLYNEFSAARPSEEMVHVFVYRYYEHETLDRFPG
jgi:4-amino-4-deoxy-L-arabinose transferase-like glycosyltransferase